MEEPCAPVVLPLGRSPAVAVLASAAQIYMEGWGHEALRPPPALHELGLRPCFPHEFARCVERALEHELVLLFPPLRMFPGPSRHLCSPESYVETSCVLSLTAGPNGRSGPPTGRGSAGASRTPRP